MVDPLRPELDVFRPQIEALASKGWGADRIYRYMREAVGLVSRVFARVPRSFVRRVVSPFRESMARTRAALPSNRSDRLRQGMATPTSFRSPLGNRYLLEFQFKTIHSQTGEIKTITNTIGFRRLDRMGKFMDIAQQRVIEFSGDTLERYVPTGYEPLMETLRFTNFFRTVNR